MTRTWAWGAWLAAMLAGFAAIAADVVLPALSATIMVLVR